MTILENAVRHFKTGREQLNSVSVPEWGDNGVPAQLYYKPVMSLSEKGRILKAYQGENPAEALAKVLIIRALDESGRHVFAPSQKAQLLREVDEDVIARIVNQMQGDSEMLAFEDAEKN